MDSDSSSYYETTYSEDERIERALQHERKLHERHVKEVDLARKRLYEEYLKEDLPIFKLKGLKFCTWRHLKIKFTFQPADITKFVNKNVIFYVSLRYKDENWRIKRDTIPANYKWKVYKLFYDNNYFAVSDENILNVLMKIYEIMVDWSKQEEEFRLEKFERYKNGADVELDSDDEVLFLTSEERVMYYQKKLAILRRMIPPKSKKIRKRK